MTRPSKTRIVTYEIRGPFSGPAVEALLFAASAQGVVTGFDAGRGELVWFSGPPSAALRRLRDLIKALADDHYRVCRLPKPPSSK